MNRKRIKTIDGNQHISSKRTTKLIDVNSANPQMTFTSSFRRAENNSSSSYGSVSRIRENTKNNSTKTYVWGSVAPKIAPEFETLPKEVPQSKQPHVYFPSKPTKNTATKPNFKWAKQGVKAFVACVLLFGTIGFVNITFTSLAIASSAHSQEVSTQIQDAREVGKSLEVEYGVLSNHENVKNKALELGMESPSNVIQINLEKDAVVTKDDGTISLTSTIKQACK